MALKHHFCLHFREREPDSENKKKTYNITLKSLTFRPAILTRIFHCCLQSLLALESCLTVHLPHEIK